MASLELKKISKRFGNEKILSRVDLRVKEGEFCVLLGPSGCGKSTLLQIVAGLIPQDEGSVLLDGRPVDQSTPRERDIAMVFQGYALYPHMTVAQNIGFGLRMRGMHKDMIKKQVTEMALPWGLKTCSSENRGNSRGGKGRESPWAAPWCAVPSSFCLMNP